MRLTSGVPLVLDLERSHMSRKLWLSAIMAALGAILLVVAGFANAASTSSAAKKGGTMKLNMSATDVDFTDPSLAYGTISWQIEYATALKLVNYPDKAPPAGGRLQPEAAVGLPVPHPLSDPQAPAVRRGNAGAQSGRRRALGVVSFAELDDYWSA